MERYTVLYDGECRFCRGQVKVLRSLDWPGRLGFKPLSEVRGAELDREQMYVVNPAGVAFGGAEGIRLLSRVVPLLWFAAPVLHLPFTLPVWRCLYRWVARNRYRFGKTCDSGCAT